MLSNSWLRATVFCCIVASITSTEAFSEEWSRDKRHAYLLAVSKSTVATIADPQNELANKHLKTLLSAGTKIALFPNIKNDVGTMFLSEDGLWGFIDRTSFWTKLKPEDHNLSGDFVAITRYTRIDLGFGLKLDLTPSETQPLERTGSTHYSLTIEGSRHPILPEEFKKSVNVPKSHATRVEISEDFSPSSIDYFTKASLDETFEFRKQCREQSIQTKQIGGSAGLGINWKVFNLSASAETEKTTIQSFGDDEFVVRQYFTRARTKGSYSLTRLEQCERSDKRQKDEVWFYYLNPEGNHVGIDREWAESYQLRVWPKTGQVVFTCYADYDRYFQALIDEQLDESEVAFVISRTARWRHGDSISQCSE